MDAATVRLGAVQSHVGILQELIGVGGVGGRHGDTNASSCRDLMAVYVEWLAQSPLDAQDQCGCILGLAHAPFDDAELVAAEASKAVRAAQDARRRPIADLVQKLVADRVAEGIVDGLEVVEVEIEDGKPLLATQVRQAVLDLLVKQQAVGEPGQSVVPGHVRDLRLGPASLRDVLVGDDPAAIGHGLARNGYLSPVRGLHDDTCGLTRRQVRQHLVAELLGDPGSKGLRSARCCRSSCAEQPGFTSSRDSP